METDTNEQLAAFERVMRAMALEQQPITFDVQIGGIGSGNAAEEIEKRRVLVDSLHNSSNNQIEIQLDDGPVVQKYHCTIAPGDTINLRGMPFNHGIRVSRFVVTGNDTTLQNLVTMHGRLKRI